LITIKKITLKDGSIRYRACGVSAGKHPDGKRRQITITRHLKKEVEAELRRIGYQLDNRTYVPRWDGTVAEVLDRWLASACFEKADATALSYRDSARIPRLLLGHRKARSITRQDVEFCRDYALEKGKTRGGTPGSGLSPRTVRLMLSSLSAAFTHAEQDGLISVNPCRFVKPPRAVRAPLSAWTETEARRFLEAASRDRLHACWIFSLLGMRRGEVCGLRWADVDLDAGMVSIRQSRVLVGAVVSARPPKTVNGIRRLPLWPGLVGLLKQLQARQGAEMLEAGSAYQSSGLVASDELGGPIHPEWYSDTFARLCKEAGVRRVRLHDARHTACSLLEHAGVPVSIIARWAGHHSGTFTMDRYVHADDVDLAVAMDALARVYGLDGDKTVTSGPEDN
jgi:integrase